jgi:hypothetical protein
VGGCRVHDPDGGWAGHFTFAVSCGHIRGPDNTDNADGSHDDAAHSGSHDGDAVRAHLRCHRRPAAGDESGTAG